MANAYPDAVLARLNSQQRRGKRKSDSDESFDESRQNLDDPIHRSLSEADAIRHSPKNDSLFKRRFQQRKRQKGVKQESSSLLKNPVHLATARALYISWFALIPSWGLTLIYLNIHLFGRLALPSMFAKFGSEWIPVKAKALSKPSNFMGGLEIAAIITLDILALIFIALIAGAVMLAYDMVSWIFDLPLIGPLLKSAPDWVINSAIWLFK